MLIRIFLAENNRMDLEQICGCIRQWSEKKKTMVTLDRRSTLTEADADAASQCDILMLNIDMPETDGITFARLAREQNQAVPVVFFTEYTEFAISGYDVRATDFIIKPVAYSSIERTLNRFFTQIQQPGNESIVLQNGFGVDAYDASSIIYIEAGRHDTRLHLTGGVKSYPMPFHKLDSLLPKPPFYNCHRSYSVNLRFVKGLSGQGVRLINGDTIRINKEKIEDFTETLTDYYHGGFL